MISTRLVTAARTTRPPEPIGRIAEVVYPSVLGKTQIRFAQAEKGAIDG